MHNTKRIGILEDVLEPEVTDVVYLLTMIHPPESNS